jgi:glyoxylase-like metal-dependent hydrolase (beta-lactamase superfamily II)
MFKLFVFLFLISFNLNAQAASKNKISLELKPIQVAPHSYYVQGLSGAASKENQGYMSNAGFVVTDDGVIIFDSLGTPVLAKKLVAVIAKITKQPIKRVIISHYHADHIYGLQVFKDMGAEIWAHTDGQEYLNSEDAQERLQQRRKTLKPWIDDKTRLVGADKWLTGDSSFTMGGMNFELQHVGPAHSDEDMALFVKEDKVLFSGDLVFKGRVPFVGNADSRLWLLAMSKLIAFQPEFMIPGHGAASNTPVADLKLTSDYLNYVRLAMGKAVKDFTSFDEAYNQTDWSQFAELPAFDDANRSNAYFTFLLMEKEALGQ